MRADDKAKKQTGAGVALLVEAPDKLFAVGTKGGLLEKLSHDPRAKVFELTSEEKMRGHRVVVWSDLDLQAGSGTIPWLQSGGLEPRAPSDVESLPRG